LPLPIDPSGVHYVPVTQKKPHPLRGLGPRMFISYSFRDAPLAEELSKRLQQLGFQVRKEDERSLLGKNLRDALPRLIGDAEVFLPLLTTASNASPWVRQEIDWALGDTAGNDAARPLFLPIVLDATKLYERVKDWVYVDATSEGQITDYHLDLVVGASLQTLDMLPLSTENIVELDAAPLRTLLQSGPRGRRFLIDSDGWLESFTDEVMEAAKGIRGELADEFLAQEERRRVLWRNRLQRMDVVLPRVIAELRSQLRGYDDFVDRGARAVARFIRHHVGINLIHLRKFAPKGSCPLLESFEEQLVKVESDIARVKGYEEQDAQWIWVAGSVEPQLPPGEDPKWGDVEFAPRSREHHPMRAFMPRRIIGSDWSRLLHMATYPQDVLMVGSWAAYCIPWVASRAMLLMDRFELPAEQAIEKVSWTLNGYERMGFP
jgi:hypothetical protein